MPIEDNNCESLLGHVLFIVVSRDSWVWFTNCIATYPCFTIGPGCGGPVKGKASNPQRNVAFAGRQFALLYLAVATG